MAVSILNKWKLNYCADPDVLYQVILDQFRREWAFRVSFEGNECYKCFVSILIEIPHHFYAVTLFF